MRREYSFVSDSDTVVVQSEITDDSFRPVWTSYLSLRRSSGVGIDLRE